MARREGMPTGGGRRPIRLPRAVPIRDRDAGNPGALFFTYNTRKAKSATAALIGMGILMPG